MDNALNRNIIIGLYNDIFDHRQGNKIIYYIISIFCIEFWVCFVEVAVGKGVVGFVDFV